MEPQVRLVFFGQVLDGFQVDEVKRGVRELFRLDDARLEQMFSGARTVIKRSLAPADAARYVATFEKLGARLNTEPADAPEPAPESAEPADAFHAQARQARLDAQAEARAERLEATRARRDPTPAAAEGPTDELPGWWGTGLAGRMARRPYAAGALLGWSAIGWMVLILLSRPGAGLAVLLGLGILVCGAWTFRLTVLRLHDLGVSGWWVLIGLVPYLGTLAGLLLSLLPGSTMDNKYGPVPDPGSVMLRLVVGIAVIAVGTTVRHSFTVAAKPSTHREARAGSPDEPPNEEVLSAILKSAPAREAFRGAYWKAATHKAFASSDGGAFGWQAGAGTARAAQEQALAQCEQNRQPYSGECTLLSVDNEWAD